MQNKNKKYIFEKKAKNMNNLELQKTNWEQWMENIEDRIFYQYKIGYCYKKWK